jgi:MraZ protein
VGKPQITLGLLSGQTAALQKQKHQIGNVKGEMATVDYFERKLDDKRRLTIPVELRDEFVSGVVMTKGFSKYLHMYPKAVWDEQVEPQLQGDILDEKVADLNVQFRTGKSESPLDQKQGRITIEPALLEFAGIDRAVVAVRAGRYWRLLAA